jgi:hypothetical protein
MATPAVAVPPAVASCTILTAAEVEQVVAKNKGVWKNKWV